MIRKGVELRKQDRDAEALEEFRKAYELAKTPRALAQIGTAEHALGRWSDAESHIQEALQAKDDPWIKKMRATLESALTTISRHVGSLEVLGTPPGAEVVIEGRSVARLPMQNPSRVSAGDVVIELRHPGYRTIARTVTVGAGEIARETITLQPIVPQESPLPVLGATTIRQDAKPAEPDRPGTASEQPSAFAAGGAWYGPVKWGAVAVGSLLIAGGVAGLIVHERRVGDFNDRTVPGTMTKQCMLQGDTVLGGQDCTALANSANNWRSAAIGGFVAGGALVVTSVVLHLAEPRPRGDKVAQTQPIVACGLDPWRRGGACVLRF